jgi:RimJ/RimL family protein N-acetyltransferase
MDLAAARSAIKSLPRAFFSKDGRLLRLEILTENVHRQFLETYLGFQPRNSFQGLPPLKDEVCAKWVRQMIATGINVVARTSDTSIVGHTALFPIDQRKCEMLVVVWPGYQNVGVGTELTETCVELGVELGFERIWLPVDATNLRARHVYAKCGFEYSSGREARELDMVCELGDRRRRRAAFNNGKIEKERSHETLRLGDRPAARQDRGVPAAARGGVAGRPADDPRVPHPQLLDLPPQAAGREALLVQLSGVHRR